MPQNEVTRTSSSFGEAILEPHNVDLWALDVASDVPYIWSIPSISLDHNQFDTLDDGTFIKIQGSLIKNHCETIWQQCM